MDSQLYRCLYQCSSTGKCVSYTWVEDVVIPVIAVVTSADPAGACNPTSITAPTFEATHNCLASALSVIPTASRSDRSGLCKNTNVDSQLYRCLYQCSSTGKCKLYMGRRCSYSGNRRCDGFRPGRSM
ncbi:MAG: hypothetical protein IPO92_10820 [Saprospiraceae bacterium]|nr:hypothetical protein [Saprospiraceae bacterium]